MAQEEENSVDGGHLKSVYDGDLKSVDGGDLKSVDGGDVNTVDGGSSQHAQHDVICRDVFDVNV